MPEAVKLADRLAAIKAASRVTPEARAAMDAASARLRESGLLDGLPRAGERAPDFSLVDETGETASLTSLLASGPLVLAFYRGVWCPYCNADLAALDAALPRVRELGATLVAVSPQTPANSRKARRDGHLGFPILSDPGNAVAARYGLRFRLAPEVQALYEGFGIDLPKVNGEVSWTLPVPARFVIGSDGVVAYAEADPDYTTRPEPDAFLTILETLARRGRVAA